MEMVRLVPPARGRPHVGLPLTDPSAWNGPHGLCVDGPVLWRIDLDAARATPVPDRTMPDTVYALAVSATGRYAFSDGARVMLEGAPPVVLQGVTRLAFGAGGDLWAQTANTLVRVDGHTGSVRWTAEASGDHLVVDGDTAACVSWGTLRVVTGDGVVHALETGLKGDVSAVTTRGGTLYTVAGEGLQHTLAVRPLDTRAEALHPLPPGYAPRALAASDDGWVAWCALPTGLAVYHPATGQHRGLDFPTGENAGLHAHGDTWRAYHADLCAIARCDRTTGHQLGVDTALPEGLWGLSVANDGRVASAHQGGWRLMGPDGALLHEGAVDGQVSDIALAADGSSVVLLCPEDAGVRVTRVDTEGFVVRASRVVPEASAVQFHPDGQRVALVGDGTITLLDAVTLDAQCVLAHSDKHAALRGVVLADGRVTAHDSRGRAVCFDDPGPLPPSKKPPRTKPALVVPSAKLYASPHRTDNAHTAAVYPWAGRLAAMDAHAHAVLWFDPVAKKIVARDHNVHGYFLLEAPVQLRETPTGAALWCQGETGPFATLDNYPTLAACSRDGRYVALGRDDGITLVRRS